MIKMMLIHARRRFLLLLPHPTARTILVVKMLPLKQTFKRLRHHTLQ